MSLGEKIIILECNFSNSFGFDEFIYQFRVLEFVEALDLFTSSAPIGLCNYY